MVHNKISLLHSVIKGTPSKKTPKKSPKKGRTSARQPKLKRRRIIESKNSSDEDSGNTYFTLTLTHHSLTYIVHRVRHGHE